MKDVRVSFEIYEGEVKDLIEYEKIRGHVIFDVKLGEAFRRKVRYVGEGFRATTQASVTYSSVVRLNSVRILLMIAALNDLEVQGADIKNTYLTALCKEKVWLRDGPEFGVDPGKTLLVVRVLHGFVEYYEYVLMYVDDLLGISHDSRILLESIMNKERFKQKNDSICPMLR